MMANLLASTPIQPYSAILVVIAIVVTIGCAILLLTHLIGPRRKGPIKHDVYESGMPLITGARGRFNARFYVVALLFLLFDVEIVILWPWAMVYYRAATGGDTVPAGGLGSEGFLLAAGVAFLSLLLVGFVYEWKRGALKWD